MILNFLVSCWGRHLLKQIPETNQQHQDFSDIRDNMYGISDNYDEIHKSPCWRLRAFRNLYDCCIENKQSWDVLDHPEHQKH